MRIRDMNDVQQVMNRYPEDMKEKITFRVKRYLKACTKLGVPLDPMVRVWQEAIETIEVEEKMRADEGDNWPRFEAIRSYEVYTSPVDLKF